MTLSWRARINRAVVVALASLAALGASPGRLAAQTYWRIPGALGGAFVGTGAGWIVDIARWGGGGSDLRGPELTMTPIGMGIGGVLGFMGGLNADRRLARGDTLTRQTRVVLRATTFLAPVATGSAIAFAIINPSDEGSCVPYSGPDPNIICTYRPPSPKIASDVTVALVTIGGGAILGFIAQRKFARALWPRARVGVTGGPTTRGVTVSFPAGW